MQRSPIDAYTYTHRCWLNNTRFRQEDLLSVMVERESGWKSRESMLSARLDNENFIFYE